MSIACVYLFIFVRKGRAVFSSLPRCPPEPNHRGVRCTVIFVEQFLLWKKLHIIWQERQYIAYACGNKTYFSVGTVHSGPGGIFESKGGT